MQRFKFVITVFGNGDTQEEAWPDAVEGFQLSLDSIPEEAEVTVVEENIEG